MKTQLIFKYIGMGIIAMLLSMCEAGGSDGGTGGSTTTDISTYTLSYEEAPQGTATTLSPTWNKDIANVTYAINHSAVGTVIAPTIDTSTGTVTIATDTTAGSYTISATGSESYSGTATAKVYVTVTPAPTSADTTGKTALTTAINAGITAWGNEGDFNYIITTAVTDMSELFQNKTEFNGDITKWNTNAVTFMRYMFAGATKFNQPIGDWNTSAVQYMNYMFYQATAFNQDIDNWNVGAVEPDKFSDIFTDSGMANNLPCWYEGTTANYFSCFTLSYDLSPQGTAATVSPTWKKKSDENMVTVTATYEISHDTPAGTVTAPTTSTDASTGEVTIATGTTAGSYTVTVTTIGNHSITTPLTITVAPAPDPSADPTSTDPKVRDRATGKAALTTAINDGITIWGNEGDFNYIITSTITDMSELFKENTTFNGKISKWNTGAVKDMSYMFNRATKFNQPIGNWNTSKVEDMNSMFSGTQLFNQSIGDWNTSKVKDMTGMFYLTSKFNQDLDKWNVGAVEADKDHLIFDSSAALARVPCWYNSSADSGKGAIRVPRPDDCPVAD